jgi:hypothetical protein
LLIYSVKQAFLNSTNHNSCFFSLTVMADMGSKRTIIKHTKHVVKTH